MTISAWIMRRQDGEVKALVHRHRKLHIWLQPGGHIEHTENPVSYTHLTLPTILLV